MIRSFTAVYELNGAGYIGKILEIPEIEVHGIDVEECQKNLRDALNVLVQKLARTGGELPPQISFIERISINVNTDKPKTNGVAH